MSKRLTLPADEGHKAESGERDLLLESLEEALAWAQGEKSLRVTTLTKYDAPTGNEAGAYTEEVRVVTGKPGHSFSSP